MGSSRSDGGAPHPATLVTSVRSCHSRRAPAARRLSGQQQRWSIAAALTTPMAPSLRSRAAVLARVGGSAGQSPAAVLTCLCHIRADGAAEPKLSRGTRA